LLASNKPPKAIRGAAILELINTGLRGVIAVFPRLKYTQHIRFRSAFVATDKVSEMVNFQPSLRDWRSAPTAGTYADGGAVGVGPVQSSSKSWPLPRGPGRRRSHVAVGVGLAVGVEGYADGQAVGLGLFDFF
jgi:hypothetical protein